MATPDVSLVAAAQPARSVLVRFDAGELSWGGAAQSVYAGKLGKYADVNLAASASLANGCYAYGNFVGKVFGIAYQLLSGSAPIGVMIDGLAYDVPLIPYVNPFGRSVTQILNRMPGVILARDLDPAQPHFFELTFPNHLTEARRWRFYGLLLDRDAGYQDEAPHGFIPSDVYALTTSLAAITRATTSTDASNYGAGIRKLFFVNTTASAITVSLSRTSAVGNIFRTIDVPANGSAEWDPGLVLQQNGYLYAMGSAAGVNCYVEEAY